MGIPLSPRRREARDRPGWLRSERRCDTSGIVTSRGSSRLIVLAAALLFSTGGAAIKAISLSSWQIAGFRSGIAAVALWMLLPSWRRCWAPRVVLVGAAYAATLVLYVTANTLTTAANAIFLQTTAPLYVLLLGPPLLGESNARRDYTAVSLLAAGLVALLMGADAAQRTAPDPLRGDLVAAASGVTWGLALLGLRWLAREPSEAGYDPAGGAVVAGNAIAFGVCLPFALPVAGTATDWALVSYLGFFQIGLAYVALVRGVRGLRALDVSLLIVLEPLLNPAWAWLVHAETPGAASLAGCGLILAGVLVQALRPPG